MDPVAGTIPLDVSPHANHFLATNQSVTYPPGCGGTGVSTESALTLLWRARVTWKGDAPTWMSGPSPWQCAPSDQTCCHKCWMPHHCHAKDLAMVIAIAWNAACCRGK